MNAIFDNLLVGALLLASLGYAIYKLGPRALRKRILAALRLSTSAGKSESACGGCDNCGSDTAATPSSSAEIKIPVAKIGRRV
jgi:hypothetical protein